MPPAERKCDPTRQPGAYIVGLAYGRPDGGGGCEIGLCARSRERRVQVSNVMHVLKVQRGTMLLPAGAELPEVLRELGWRRGRQVADEVSGLPLDLYEGPRAGQRRTR